MPKATCGPDVMDSIKMYMMKTNPTLTQRKAALVKEDDAFSTEDLDYMNSSGDHTNSIDDYMNSSGDHTNSIDDLD
jgi:hypothetical protein